MSIYDNAGVVQIPSGYKAGTTDNLYSVLPANGNGDFNATRGSSATRVNKDGLIESVATNVPRLDYPLIDGVVQDCPALLLEPSRENKITYSEDFSNVYWTKNGSSVTSGFISPDGTDNAFKLTKTSSGNSIVRLVSGLTNVNYTFSIYIKKVNGSENVSIILPNGGNTQVTISNEWERYDVTSLPSGGTGAFVGVILSAIGDEVLIYGAQLEQGSYATSYIPTSGSTATRSADVCNGSGTSAEFNDSEGVLFAEIAALANDSTFRVINLRGNADNLINFGFKNTSNSIYFYKEVNNVAHSPVTPSQSVNILEFNKAAVSYSTSTNYLWVNGFKTVSSTGVGSFSTSLSTLNFDNNSTIPFYGKTKQLSTFKTALTDSELETLTSWDSFNAMATGQLYTIE